MTEVDMKKTDFVKTKASNMYMIYKNYHDEMFNQLGEVLNSYFGFDIECNNGEIDFYMNGRLYTTYLNQGYIVLQKEEKEKRTENRDWVNSVEEFIELIKDLATEDE